MRRTVILYSAAMAVLIFILKFFEYRFLVRDLSLEFYLGVIALLFTAVGIWAGNRLTKKKMILVPATPFEVDEDNLKNLGISKREHEVLRLMAQGLSNQEIADKLFVSLNTIKTHTSNLFYKLEAKRRTQAIQKAKALNLIP